MRWFRRRESRLDGLFASGGWFHSTLACRILPKRPAGQDHSAAKIDGQSGRRGEHQRDKEGIGAVSGRETGANWTYLPFHRLPFPYGSSMFFSS